MAESENANARKSKTLTRHETRPLMDLAVNTRSRMTPTTQASPNNSSSVTNKRKALAQTTTPQRQQTHDDELSIAVSITTQINLLRSPELPIFDYRVPVFSTTTTKPYSAKSRRSIQRAPDNPRVYPAPTHNRPSPYTPTLQHGGAFPKERGNAPAGVSDEVWAKAFNAANTHIYNLMAGSTRIVLVREAREHGLTRDLAVEDLIGKGVLRRGFVDASP